MRDRLESYLKGLFAGAPDTPRNRELEEEIIQNNLDKYDDLVREGTPEAAAFNLVVGELGDVSSLLEEIRRSAPAPAPREPEWNGVMRGVLLAVGVMFFILSPAPFLILSKTDLVANLAPVMAIFLIAMGVGLLVFRAKVLPRPASETPREDKKEDGEKDSLFGAVSGLLWVLILCFYFVVSFKTGAWYVTWLAFPIGGALEGLVKAIFDLVRGDRS